MQLADTYKPLTNQQMKPATAKALSKFWTDTLKQLKLQFQVDADGKHSSIDTLGEDFIIDTFIWKGAITDDVQYVTLGELLETRAEEQDLVQFEIQPSNVEKLLTSTEYGLLKGFKLMRLPELIKMPNSDQYIIGGGRNRAVGLATIMRQTYGYENMKVPVTVFNARTVQEVVEYIKLSNTSRTMTATEKTQLKLAQQGTNLQVFSSPEEIFEQAAKAKTLTALKDLSRMAFASILGDTQVGRETTINAVGDIGANFFTQLTKGLNAHAKKSADALLVVLPQGQVFQLVVTQAAQALANNWSAYKAEITVDTGRKNADGAPIMECNISRHGPKAFGKALSELILADVGEQLKTIAEQEQAKAQSAKKAKAAESEQANLRKQIQALDNSLATFASLGTPIPAEMTTRIEESKAKLQAQIDALDAQEQSKAAPAEAPAATGVQQPAYSEAVSNLLS